jgi:S1-C subfamily serine protease
MPSPSTMPPTVAPPDGPETTRTQPSEVQIDDLSDKLDEISKKISSTRKKDNWDRVSAVSGLMSGIAVAVIGVVATRGFNRRQQLADDRRQEEAVRVQELQAIPVLFPHLLSEDERQKELALLTLDRLGSTDIVAALAPVLGGAGAAGALTHIASTGTEGSAALAQRALGSLFESLHLAVVRLRSGETWASGLLVEPSGYILTASYMGSTDAIDVQLSNGSRHTAHTVKADKPSRPGDDVASGLALLRIDDHSALLPAYPTGATREVDLGEELICFSFGSRDWFGRVATVRGVAGSFVLDPTSRPIGEVALTSLSISTPGDGGAPVVDQNGNVAGLVYGGAGDQYTLVITAGTIADFLA